MVAMVASASGYGALRRFLSVPEGQRSDQGGLGFVQSASVAVSSKQRASIKWLLSKAFNNRVPDNLQEPFYRDHEDQEHLKPPIVGGLASAELYCLALANMYSDPNYHSLNHCNILQTLSRKGVPVQDPPDAPLTETVLIQTNPIRMSAHMCVMEALMVLYAREVVTPERVAAAAQRFGCSLQPAACAGHEDGLLVWVNAACAALNDAESSSPQPAVPRVATLQELCDGTALAALVCFYCPDALPRECVRVGRVSSLQDCLHNLMLVQRFCQTSLPHNIFHMMVEDVTYMRGSMRQNLVAMLADLFNVLEVHPAKCVKYPATASGEGSNAHGVRHKRCLPPPPPAAIPDLRPERDATEHTPFTVPRSPSQTVVSRARGAQRSACSTPERQNASPLRSGAPAPAAPPTPAAPEREEFVVHRGKGVTTLSSMAKHSDDRGLCEGVAAGRPSNWEDSRSGATYAGRRSRRSSISDDSQLTVENFGGSQDRLNFCGRNPEKELATITSMRKISAPAGPVIEPAVPVRTLKQDIRGSLQFMYDELAQEANDRSTPKPLERQNSQPHQQDSYTPLRRQHSSDTITLKQNYANKGSGDGFFLNNNRDITDGDISNKMSFADVRIRSNGDQSGVQSKYSGGSETEDVIPLRKKSTSFVTPVPNTTTWQQQSMQQELQPNGANERGGGDDGSGGVAMAAQLNNIRLKLEEKRRRIEMEKHKMEFSMNRQRQQVGQQAFLQAVTRGKAGGGRTPGGEEAAPATPDTHPPPGDKPFTLQDISSEAANAETRWLQDNEAATVDADSMGIDEYQQSIAKMNSSLHDIQTDIARLVSQQNQLQNQALLSQQQHPQHNQQPPVQQHHHHIQHQPQQNQQHHHHHLQQQLYQQQQLQQQQLQQQKLQQQQLQQQQLQQQQLQQQQQQQLQQQLQQQQQQLYQQQQQQQQHQYHQQQQQYQQHQPQSNIPHLHNQYSSQHNISGPRHSLNTSFGSSPHIPHDYAQQRPSDFPLPHAENVQQNSQNNFESEYGSPRQFYLHDGPPAVQRRTWAQNAASTQDAEPRGWQLHQQTHQPQQTHQSHHTPHQYQPPYQEPQRTWKSPSPQPESRWTPQPAFPVHYNTPDRYHNGDSQQNHLSYTVINPPHSASPPLTSSPQRRAKTPQRQGSLPENIRKPESVSLQQLSHPVSAPIVDDMEPQNISFIGNAEDDALQEGINKLNISSGTRTYRIPSPTRPFLNRNSFQQQARESSHSDASNEGGDSNEKKFYISFDTDQPKRPKPPLRPKRGSPRKERTPTDYRSPERESFDDRLPWQDRVPEPFVVHQNVNAIHSAMPRDDMNHRETPPRERIHRETIAEPAAIVIAENIDPNSAEEMEKKKERIMLLSLQRRERAEEARARAEAAAAARRARDEQVAEQRAAKKEEQAKRREAILHQYKLKKAIDEAEREGKVLDKAELLASLRPGGSTGGSSPSAPPSAAKLRSKASGVGARVRPKTIHVDSSAVEAAGLLGRKQGSSTNLTAYGGPGGSTMRRDYYRGSQDSLADRAGLYRDSPVEESGGMSPGTASNSSSALGRRGSYRTSRERESDEAQSQVRGRTKYPTYQNNFKAGRKSSSLMNLCDSGLGRATPPRRAPSPGMRTLPSPASGPGSLPGGIGKRANRHIDDNASDVSSTHSSIMDYSGPRLYKQPATKSNRGIMLNAVEYCVFPGVVNREAKRRVLEEIARSESKHFLVLFRDAGCQFRALYSYCPDTENVSKLYGTGPRQVNDRMFDKFFKYNSGSKCFSQIHTKHLTVTIDAFTIHNSLWQGKKVQLPSKKDMALVI